jgi:uncharacterized protein YjcR
MGKKKTEEKQKAFELYCDTELTQKEIASIVHITPQQLSKWAQDDNWEMHRSARSVTVESLITNWYKQIATINKEIQDKQEGIPIPAQIDMINKIKNNIEGLSKKYNLSAYHSVLKEMLEWLHKNFNDSAKEFGPLMLDFLKHKANTISSDKSFG